MNRRKKTMPLLGVVGLLLVAAPPFIAPMQSQQADTAAPWPAAGTKTTFAEAVRRSVVHDKPIERFSVNNADVRAVFKQLSEFSGADIVLGDKVSGTVTLNVTNKTWREILAIVCKITNLTVIKEPSYIYVVPAEDFRKQQLADATMNQQEAAIEELKREVIKLENVNAQEMSTSINSLLSSRGKITVVERNNAIIIFDTEHNIEQVKKMIKQLDIETDQVSISCKIIEVSSGVLQSLGVRWGYFDRVAGTDVSAEHLPVPATTGTQATATVKNAGVVDAALERLTYGVLGQDKFAATLEYLFNNNKAEVVAQPQITTLDNKEARVFMGSQVPVKYLDRAFNTVIQMVEAGTELIVTPHIAGEKRIMLNLAPKKRSYTMTNDQPIINEQSATTNVVVSDGETVVIAGLTSNDFQNLEEGIPVLKDIPFIGHLFKRTKKSLTKSDLIVFVTPHIINKKVEAISGAVK
jgi:type IV pilus secretin PilQ/predicted competence protein